MIDSSKNAIVGWLLNFRIRMFVKSAVNSHCLNTAPMIESLRTTQIAFFRFATPSGFLGGAETRYKKYSCKGPCKGKSYETICENIVSRYQTLVSSLPREAVFLQRRPKTEFITGRTDSPVITSVYPAGFPGCSIFFLHFKLCKYDKDK